MNNKEFKKNVNSLRKSIKLLTSRGFTQDEVLDIISAFVVVQLKKEKK